MTKKKNHDSFIKLSWDDLREWAGSKIVSRGRNYQQQDLVSDLAATDDHSLVAWVEGSSRYATCVSMKEGRPISTCTCPYAINCKHGVAVVLEYLKCIENGQAVPKANKQDKRLKLLDNKQDYSEEEFDTDDLCSAKTPKVNIDTLLKDKTKTQLIEMIHEFSEKYPQIAEELTDRHQIVSGDIKQLVARLKKEIRLISQESGWQNHWNNEGYTPDYSGICSKLENILKAGHADEVLELGKELIERGNQQVEQSHDDGETAMEIESCIPVIIKSLEQSTLPPVDKLSWAIDVILTDDYGVLELFGDYLHQCHSKSVWNSVADRLLATLNTMKHASEKDDFHRNYKRDRLSNWIIYALESANRGNEIIPLCEAEAVRTGSYERLVERLIAAERYQEARSWIQKGMDAVKDKWPGIASGLRNKMRDIRIHQKDWQAVVAMYAEDFVDNPSKERFSECHKANIKTKTWPQMRQCLLTYLENGTLPWKQNYWPLGVSGQNTPDIPNRMKYPITEKLIDIAILEKRPDDVLHWYDQLPKKDFRYYGVDENEVAHAILDCAPERAVSIWKNLAEKLIGQANPNAYSQASGFLRKAAKVMVQEKKQAEWNNYLQRLKTEHARKRRLIEILDGFDGHPIIKKNCNSSQ